MSTLDLYHELSFYTLNHRGKDFIHQHIVDAYTAQTADEKTKNITIFFALAGLYLFIEKNFTGRQVQQAHLKMAQKSKDYKKFNLPDYRGAITVKDILIFDPGEKRDDMIRQWCIAVWDAYSGQRVNVIALTEELLAYK